VARSGGGAKTKVKASNSSVAKTGARFLELFWIRGGPHRGGLFVGQRCIRNLRKHILLYPPAEFSVAGMKFSPFIQRRAVGKPPINGIASA
jgi:hypothetical protein